jgi:cobalt-zinc-cadmium efflux system outer membrane protein
MVYCQMLRYLTFTVFLLTPLAQAAEPLSFDALSIERAVQIALEHNQDSRLSAFAVDSAKAARLIAGAPPNPLLTVQTFNINPQRGIGSGNFTEKTVDTTVRLDQLLERGNKRKLRVEVATGLESAAGNDYRDVRRQLRPISGAATFRYYP